MHTASHPWELGHQPAGHGTPACVCRTSELKWGKEDEGSSSFCGHTGPVRSVMLTALDVNVCVCSDPGGSLSGRGTFCLPGSGHCDM